LDTVASIVPFAMAYRTGGSTMDAVISSMTGLGALVAGGYMSLEAFCEAVMAAGHVCGGQTDMSGSLVVLPTATAAFGFAAAMGIDAGISVSASRGRVGSVVMPAVSVLGGETWEPTAIVVSPVYASGWSGTRGVNIIGTIVYRVAPEDIVYLVEPESIVYGQIE